MGYTAEQIRDIEDKFDEYRSGLIDLQFNLIREAEKDPNGLASEHLLHGAGRRIVVMRRALERIFEIFPLGVEKPLPLDLVSDVQINLHAFVVNLYGVFENFAWAFVHHHGLLESFGDRKKVSMFGKHLAKHLPRRITDFLEDEQMQKWRRDYLVNYRDALAHRIPLYVPPAMFTDSDADKHRELEKKRIEAWSAKDVKEAIRIHDEQMSLGSPSLVFLHSFADDGPSVPVYIHPQMLCDAVTVTSFAEVFLKNWRGLA